MSNSDEKKLHRETPSYQMKCDAYQWSFLVYYFELESAFEVITSEQKPSYHRPKLLSNRPPAPLDSEIVVG
ncbi:hypothetical protein SEA_WEASELS2_57 [Rhodococcus phage Weasels2]|uniref:Uncharacterized protein n=1 Tax=Rhodococcus phage Weasels2 TaxID=1897437 RepID=A0A1I9SAR6_9CAUD|nr:hypothetical protein FDH04_gp057 [Rhodococcus phage Weasels2]AOZ63872.1 hypothetical protein SEA_WEASELS2_57 [Rhodococcus phage Weasels2]